MKTIFFLIFIIYIIVSACFCSWLAHEKGRSQTVWSILGGLFGVFALLVLGFAPSLKTEQKSVASSSEQVPATADTTQKSESETSIKDLKSCPDCLEMIKLQARKCRFCGREFTVEEVQAHVKASEDEARQQHDKEQERIQTEREARMAKEQRQRELQGRLDESNALNVEKLFALEGNGLSHYICQNDLKGVQNMLRLGADVNRPTYYARSLFKDTPLENALDQRRIGIANALIDSGANLPNRSVFRLRPILHQAVLLGDERLVERLLALGANVLEKDIWGRTAPEFAENQAIKNSGVILALKSAPIRVSCPQCKAVLNIPQTFRGSAGKCNHCGQGLKVPR